MTADSSGMASTDRGGATPGGTGQEGPGASTPTAPSAEPGTRAEMVGASDPVGTETGSTDPTAASGSADSGFEGTPQDPSAG